MNTPEGWTRHNLSDFFTAGQIKHMVAVHKKHNGDLEKMIVELRPYFQSLSEQLNRHGLVPAYAAYAVPFWIDQALKKKEKP